MTPAPPLVGIELNPPHKRDQRRRPGPQPSAPPRDHHHEAARTAAVTTTPATTTAGKPSHFVPALPTLRSAHNHTKSSKPTTVTTNTRCSSNEPTGKHCPRPTATPVLPNVPRGSGVPRPGHAAPPLISSRRPPGRRRLPKTLPRDAATCLIQRRAVSGTAAISCQTLGHFRQSSQQHKKSQRFGPCLTRFFAHFGHF